MFHRLPRAAAGMALVLVLAGCGSSTATPSGPTFSGSIVMIPKQMGNPYFNVVYAGAKNAAQAYGGTLSQVGPSAADATLQIPLIKTATGQHAKAIIVSADDANAVAPALKAAMKAGIKVVGYDSSPAVGAYNVFVDKADPAGIGKSLADMACDEAPSCSGEIAVLSGAQTATDQNAWIAAMQGTLKDSKYSKLVWDGVVYGNGDPAVSSTQAQDLLTAHPNLKVIVSTSTVGIVAAAQLVKTKGLTGKVFVTGLGTPKSMVEFVKGGEAPEFALWNVIDLGYLAYSVAVDLANGTIKGTPGETFTVPTLNGGAPYKIGANSVVVLGPPFVFNAKNVDQYAASFGF